jgi:hypothetical protein
MRKIAVSIGLLVVGLLLASCGGEGEPASVVVNPSSAELEVNKTQQFEGFTLNVIDDTVTWSVQESGGGTITASGLYTAPAKKGTYHVIVTSHYDTSKKTVVPITVTAG